MTHEIDLGPGHSIAFCTHGPDVIVGAIETHPDARNGEPCSGSIAFNVPEADAAYPPDRPRWTVECWDPLTLSPSIACRACGAHGWVREGKWVEA